MKFKFEDLKIGQKSMDLGEEIYLLSKRFPETEKFNLSSQILRAVDSIVLNISEGSILQTGPEYRKFIGYSIRSLAEVVTCLFKAQRRDYMLKEDFLSYYRDCHDLMNMMIAFRKVII